MLAHVRGIERVFVEALGSAACALKPEMLIVPDGAMRGRFLAFRTERAGEIVGALTAKNIIADYRGDRLRIGFSIYHSESDALRLVEALA
jgi:selenocysteine lyase/cysteine desulfurase